MTCEHISKALDKINNLVRKTNDSDPSVCEKVSYIPWDKLYNLRDEVLGDDVERKKAFDFFLFVNMSSAKVINTDGYNDSLSGIFDELKYCDCYNNLSRSSTDKYDKLVNSYNDLARNSVDKGEAERILNNYNDLVTKYNVLGEKNKSLIEKYNDLVDKVGDLDTKRQELEEERDGIREELHGERLRHANESGNERLRNQARESAIQIENTRLRERLEASNADKIDLRRRLEDKEEEVNVVRREKENQIARLENRLDEKNVIHNQRVENLNNQLTTLLLESGEKDSELARKNDEIERLKNQAKSSDKRAEESQEELLNEKVYSEKGNLELFATELGVSLERTNGLVRYHERLFRARKDCNRNNIETHENNITRVKEELQNARISVVNIQEICRKCERIAEFRWELEKSQKEQTRTNVNDWRNINANFTPELVQEWIRHGFTYEQCQKWINTSPLWQQNRAIKEPAYYAWLRDIKEVDAEWVLNNGNEQELGQEFFQWYQEQEQQQYEAQQEVPTNR